MLFDIVSAVSAFSSRRVFLFLSAPTSPSDADDLLHLLSAFNHVMAAYSNFAIVLSFDAPITSQVAQTCISTLAPLLSAVHVDPRAICWAGSFTPLQRDVATWAAALSLVPIIGT
jgi:hypothetical protein